MIFDHGCFLNQPLPSTVPIFQNFHVMGRVALKNCHTIFNLLKKIFKYQNPNHVFFFCFVSEIVAEKVEPINNSTLNDRYKSKLKQRRQEIMYYYLKHFESNCLSAYSSGDSNQATNNSKTTLFDGVLRKTNQNNKKIAFYFKKIKTKIKNTPLARLILNDELWASFKQIKSKRDFFSHHFKLLLIILFLKLFAIFKSMKLQHCSNFKIKNDFKATFKNQNKMNDFLYECKNYDEIAFYTKRIVDTSFDSLNLLEGKKCKNMINNLRNVYETNSKNYKKTRVKRDLENGAELTYTDFDKMSIDERNEYIDNFLREKLIHNFLENSLPDLRNNAGDFMIPVPVVDTREVAEKTIPTTKSPHFVVESMSSYILPKPNVHISSSVEITTSSPNWNLQSTTEMYPVYLITSKPKPYKPTTIINSVHSQAVTDSNILLSSNSYLSSSINWIPSNGQQSADFQSTLHSQIISSSTYRPPPPDPGNWQYIHPYDPNYTPILQDKDPALQFPYDNPATPPSSANEPFFVEPIVVSSVDQLPTNYPIPMENSSLGHNPMTVLVGSRPPEIVLLEDVTFQTVHTVYQDPDQETLNQAPGAAAEDPPMAAAAPAGAAAAPAAAPAAGGGGGGGLAGAAVLGTLLSAGAGIIGGAASAAAAGGGAATAIGAGAGTGLGQIRPDEQQGSGTALQSTDSDDEYEDWYQELTDSVSTIFSMRFVRQSLMAMYSLVMPHISFMMTSGFTMIAFLFPWLYPHIVVPLVSLMSSFTARFL